MTVNSVSCYHLKPSSDVLGLKLLDRIVVFLLEFRYNKGGKV